MAVSPFLLYELDELDELENTTLTISQNYYFPHRFLLFPAEIAEIAEIFYSTICCVHY